jgi:pectate lyase
MANPFFKSMVKMQIPALLVIAWSIPALVFSQTGSIPAFPGAEGFGADTPGGRGGKVLFVTSIEDSGEGSLRAACEAEGPRMVVFRVSGLIRLKTPIEVVNPYMTLAGQSAPGDGVCLRDRAFMISTHDVVVRFLRSRLGDAAGQPEDCISVGRGAHHVVLDHCSATWSVDECLSLDGRAEYVTVQWCLIAEALDHSKHPKGEHGYGSLMRANGPVSLHHNLWAHNDARNPRLGDNYGRAPYPFFDFRNNVIYDFGDICTGFTQGRFKANYIANFIRPGPGSRAKHAVNIGGPSDMIFFMNGNVFDGDDAQTADNTLLFDRVDIDGKKQVRIAPVPFETPDVATVAAQEAYEAVLRGAGATRPVRDAVDSRIVQSVRERRGSIINSQNQAGGWPEYGSAAPPGDGDDDGMPDVWEKARGLNPFDPSDRNLPAGDTGYTNLETVLNSLVR